MKKRSEDFLKDLKRSSNQNDSLDQIASKPLSDFKVCQKIFSGLFQFLKIIILIGVTIVLCIKIREWVGELESFVSQRKTTTVSVEVNDASSSQSLHTGESATPLVEPVLGPIVELPLLTVLQLNDTDFTYLTYLYQSESGVISSEARATDWQLNEISDESNSVVRFYCSQDFSEEECLGAQAFKIELDLKQDQYLNLVPVEVAGSKRWMLNP